MKTFKLDLLEDSPNQGLDLVCGIDGCHVNLEEANRSDAATEGNKASKNSRMRVR
ncbi:hypothetical protein [Streptococcus halotolerans]|uniref:hypothetical protein n=1 Tax=Streptococcus halotolerans TaxID=1814128 RepID=UPI000AE63C15|nr:hypothetical protein [Streptococcus halotolerans]